MRGNVQDAFTNSEIKALDGLGDRASAAVQTSTHSSADSFRITRNGDSALGSSRPENPADSR